MLKGFLASFLGFGKIAFEVPVFCGQAYLARRTLGDFACQAESFCLLSSCISCCCAVVAVLRVAGCLHELASLAVGQTVGVGRSSR